MTTLNGIPRSWDSFIQGIYARKKLVNFSRLWDECSQEEDQIATREEKMGSEYQDLIVHSKSRRTNYHKGKSCHQKSNIRRYTKYFSRIRCYTCDEKGHYARECPRNKNGSHKKKGNEKIHHAHTTEDDEPPRKKAKEESDDSSSDEEYVLISALTGTSDTWKQ